MFTNRLVMKAGINDVLSFTNKMTYGNFKPL